jgi:hypothetical protein
MARKSIAENDGKPHPHVKRRENGIAVLLRRYLGERPYKERFCMIPERASENQDRFLCGADLDATKSSI